VSAMVVRRIRLPADRRTPAAAREVIRSVVAEADLPDLLDEALLLTTEISTNGVLHGGTDIDLEVVAEDQALTVTVTDFSTGDTQVGPIPTGGREVAERGRGLQLVDHFASEWGVTHQATGKGVWFRLTNDGVLELEGREAGGATGQQSATGQESASQGGAPRGRRPRWIPTNRVRLAGAEDALPARALAALSGVRLVGADTAATGANSAVGRLLARLCGAVGATGGQVYLDRADGRGNQSIADYGLRLTGDTSQVRVPLPVSKPWVGEIALATPAAPGPHVRPLVEMTAERLGLALENDRLRRTDLRRQAWLTYLAEASELLAQSLDVELTLALIPRLVVPLLGHWCAVFSADEWGDPRLASAAHADEAALPALLYELGVVSTSREGKHSQTRPPRDGPPGSKGGLRAGTPDARTGPDSPYARLRETMRGGTQMLLPSPADGFVLPLVARGQRLGVLAVGRHIDRRQDPEEIAIVEDVARRAALAVDNARIHAERRRIAQTLQQSLLPPVLPTVPGLAFGAEYVPTLGDADVGGDFYDVVPMVDGRWLVVVGDVSGKGVGAAAVTGLVRDVLRVLVRDERPLPEMLRRINETLFERGDGRYCTLVMAAVGVGTGNRLEISLHLAGHDRPVLVDADGKASFVGTSGTALGLLENVNTPSVQLALAPGDTLVFYTDGVTERRIGEDFFGLERLIQAVGPLAGYAADVVAARLRADVLAFSPEAPRDDIAILALRNDFTAS
jgi:phosphoserine phosphatase RsbU/P